MPRPARWASLTVVTMVLVVACDGGADPTPSSTSAGAMATSTLPTPSPTTTEPTPGSTAAPFCDGADDQLVWAHEEEPPDLHLDDPANGLPITSWVWQGMWEGLYGVTADIQFHPELLEGEASVSDDGGGSVTVGYRLREGLRWSDGEPLTSDDVRFTYDVLMEGHDPRTGGGVYLIGSRQGYDQISRLRVESDREFSITYEPFFAGWRSLFPTVFPAHAFGPGAGAGQVNQILRAFSGPGGDPLPASGPLALHSWDRGDSMTLTRNEGYHGSTRPDVANPGAACVSGVRIDWVDGAEAQVDALESGEAHMVFTQPRLEFEEIRADNRFTVDVTPGPLFEHWGLNLLDPHLAKPSVREALAFALDKQEVVETLYVPILGDVLAPGGLGNSMWMPGQPAYTDHQRPAGYGMGDVESARAALESAGYVEGTDGVYAHPVDGRLSLAVGTTGGDTLRELQEQVIQAQMADAGIEITIDNVPGSDYFTTRPFSADNLLASASGGEQGDPTLVDIMQFAWVGGPWPGGQIASYLSGAVVEGPDGDPVPATSNPYGFRSEEFDQAAAACNATVDDEERAACYDELDRYVTTLEVDAERGLFMLPLTQKPDFFAYDSRLLTHAPTISDADSGGPLAHAVDYVIR
jgi:peptide/nickel transport system substrate-binding protein